MRWCAPTSAFSVWHDGKLVAQWRAATPEQRLRDVLGEDFLAHSRPLHASAGALRFSGRVGTPEAARARADHQYVYVNGRYVRDRLIAHGLRSAYEDVLHGARQPAYVLFIGVDPARVDVNVHPTKIEVRFRDARELHQGVRQAAEQALAASRATVAAPAVLARPWPAAPAATQQRPRPRRTGRAVRRGTARRLDRGGRRHPLPPPRRPTTSCRSAMRWPSSAAPTCWRRTRTGWSSSTCMQRTNGSSTNG